MATADIDSHVHSVPTTTTTTTLKVVAAPPSALDPDLASSHVDYTSRANWLRAAVLGANDGLVSVASLMIGVGAVTSTAKEMVVSGLAGLVAAACSMAIGEFVSVYTQYDFQKAQAKRKKKKKNNNNKNNNMEVEEEEEEELPSPTQAALVSAVAVMVGGMLPLVGGGFVKAWGARVGAVCGVTSVGLAGFGAAGGYLGEASAGKSAARVLLGGWLAMLASYGVLRLFALLFHVKISCA